MSFRSARPVWAAVLSAIALPLQAVELSGNVALTSDYVFRGISQSNQNAAWQAGARVDGRSGVYAALWGSRVEFASAAAADAEIDGVIGLRRPLGDDWTGELNASWFTCAGASDLNYVEWIATTTWRERRWLSVGVSRDVFATGRSGVYAQVGMRVPLNDALRLEFATGYYRLQRAYTSDYAHLQAALAWLPRRGVELRLGAHLTDHNARVLFGDLAGTRFEASLQASF